MSGSIDAVYDLADRVQQLSDANARHVTKGFRLGDVSLDTIAIHLVDELGEFRREDIYERKVLEAGDLLAIVLHLLYRSGMTLEEVAIAGDLKLSQKFEQPAVSPAPAGLKETSAVSSLSRETTPAEKSEPYSNWRVYFADSDAPYEYSVGAVSADAAVRKAIDSLFYNHPELCQGRDRTFREVLFRRLKANAKVEKSED